MQKLYAAIAIGFLAGVIDVIPMLIQKLDKASCASAFVHWLVLGVIISYVSAPIPDWAKGCAIGLFSSLAVIILVAQSDPKSVVPILVMSALLGAGVGVLSGRFAV